MTFSHCKLWDSTSPIVTCGMSNREAFYQFQCLNPRVRTNAYKKIDLKFLRCNWEKMWLDMESREICVLVQTLSTILYKALENHRNVDSHLSNGEFITNFTELWEQYVCKFVLQVAKHYMCIFNNGNCQTALNLSNNNTGDKYHNQVLTKCNAFIVWSILFLA